MKKILKIVLLLNILLTNCLAQENVELKDLKTPNSPGFQILDISPTSIERPTNPKKFTAAMLSLINNGTEIPKNFAVEFSPFWLFDKKTPINKYLGLKDNDKNSNAFSGVLKKMSISVTSVYNDSTASSLLENTNYIAFGIRTNLVTIRTKSQSNDIYKALTAYNNRVNKLKSYQDEKDNLSFLEQNNLELKYVTEEVIRNFDNKLNVVIEEAIKNKKSDEEINEIKQIANSNRKELTDKLAHINETLESIDAKRREYFKKSPDELEKKLENDKEIQECYKQIEALPLFQVDAAFAYSDAIPDNDTQKRRFNRSGVWLNAAFNFTGFDEEKINDKISFIFSGKFISDNVSEDSTNLIFNKQNAVDFGLKLEYSLKDFSISVEHLNRTYSDNKELNSERTVGVLQYKISDGIYFTGTYGKNFGEINNLFTLFGINYGFGKSSLKTN